MVANQKLVPHLWFDKEAQEAAQYYTSIFPESSVANTVTLNDTPSGDAPIVSFELWGQKFMAISAGPYFRFNPSISFTVVFDPTQDKDAIGMMDQVWNKLSDGGNVLMPLQQYPFSEKYGWVEDKYGLSWQLMLTELDDERSRIMPSLLFVNDKYGKAYEAMNFYLSIFSDSKQGKIARYPKGMEFDEEGMIMFSDFSLMRQWFIAMDSGYEHQYTFNEAVSFLVYCDTQEEIDYYWDKLSAVPEAEQCGWLKDKFGVSWQIVPTAMNEMMTSSTPEQLDRINQAVLKMKKIDLGTLQEIYNKN